MKTVFKKFFISLGVLLLVFGIVTWLLVYQMSRISCTSGYAEGWHCSSGLNISEEIITEYENKCIKEGGEFNHSPRSLSCFIPYSDWMELCRESSDCKGFCQYDGTIPESCSEIDQNTYSCSLDLVGTCSDRKQSCGNEYLVVEDGKIYRVLDFCIFD